VQFGIPRSQVSTPFIELPETMSLRALTFFMSMATWPSIATPYSAARATMCAA
jgi:hypothetical protein